MSVNPTLAKARKPTPLNRTYIHQINQICEEFKAIDRSQNNQIVNININSTNSQRYNSIKSVQEIQEAQIDLTSLKSGEYTNNLKFKQSLARDQSPSNEKQITQPVDNIQFEPKIEATFRDLGDNSPSALATVQTQEILLPNSRTLQLRDEQQLREYVNIRNIIPKDSIETSQIVSYNTSNLMSHLSLNNNTQFATITPASGTVSRPSQNSRAERVRKVRNKSSFNTTSSNLQPQSKKDQKQVQLQYLKHPYNQPVAVINPNLSETRPFKIKMKNIKMKGKVPPDSEKIGYLNLHNTQNDSNLIKVIESSSANSISQINPKFHIHQQNGDHLQKSMPLNKRNFAANQSDLFTIQNMDTLSKPLTALGVSSLDIPAKTQLQSSVTSAGNTSQLEKMIKDLIVRDKERDSTAQTILALDSSFPQNNQLPTKQHLTGFNSQNFQATAVAPENFNLSSFLDTQIQPTNSKAFQTLRVKNGASDKFQPQIENSAQFYNDEAQFIKMNQFQRTIVAQRQDIVAYQEMEKERQELERRIRERYNLLKKQQRKQGTSLPQDIQAYSRIISHSNMRPSTKRSEYQPYQQTTQSLNLMRGATNAQQLKTSRRGKRTNQTAFHPSKEEFYSGRITSMKTNVSVLNKSPSQLNKSSNLYTNVSMATQPNLILSSGGQNASVLSGATDETAQNLNSSVATYNINISQPTIIPQYSPDRGSSLEYKKQVEKNNGWISIQIQDGAAGESMRNPKIVLSNKKINRIQRKKIVINDNFSTLKREETDLTPTRYFEQSGRLNINGQINTRLGPGNYSQLRQRPRISSQQSNLRSVSSAQRHHRTKSVGNNQKIRSILPINSTQFYQIRQYKGNVAQLNRDQDQSSLETKTRVQNERFHSLSPSRTLEKENDQSPLQFQKSLVEEVDDQRQLQQPISIESAKFSNLLHDHPPKITMLSEEFKMDRNRLNKSRREVRQDINLNLNNTAISIGSGQINGLTVAGLTNSSMNNKASLNFNIRQKLNFRYIPDEDNQRYHSVESDRQEHYLNDTIQQPQLALTAPNKQQQPNINRNLRLEENESFGVPQFDDARVIQKAQLSDQNEEEDDDEKDNINDHIKIENGQIIVSDSIAMNSSMPLEQINEILSAHNIEPADILGSTKIESAFNTPNARQNYVFSSNIINTKDIRAKNQWREQAPTGSDSAGMSKTTLSTQRPLMSGGVLGTGNLFPQFTNQSKLASKAKLLSYQKGRFSSDSSFLKIRYASNNHNQNEGNMNKQAYLKNNTNIISNQIALNGTGLVKHSTAMDGEDSQCKFEGDYENKDESHNSHQPIISLSTFNQKIRKGTGAGEDGQQNQIHRNSYGYSGQIGINRLSWVNNGMKASAVGLGIRVGSVGQIQEEEENVEDEESKQSNRNALNISEEMSASSPGHTQVQIGTFLPEIEESKTSSSKLLEQTPATQGIQANDHGEKGSQIPLKKLTVNSSSPRRTQNVIPPANSGSSVSHRYAHSKKFNLNSSEDSIILSSSRMQTSGKGKGSQQARQNYVDGGSFELIESQCNLLNSNRTEGDTFEIKLKAGGPHQNQGPKKDGHRRMSLIRSGQSQIPYDPNPVSNFNQGMAGNWVQDYDSDQFKAKLDSSPASNNPKGQLLHSDDEIDIRRGLEPSTYRSLNPREPELLRQSTHSFLGFNRGHQDRDEMEEFVQIQGNGERYREFTNAQIQHNRQNKTQNKNQQQDSVSKQMIIDDCIDEDLRAQLDVDFLQNQDLIEVIDDETERTDPPSRLIKLNLESYENFLKNADNFNLRGAARQ